MSDNLTTKPYRLLNLCSEYSVSPETAKELLQQLNIPLTDDQIKSNSSNPKLTENQIKAIQHEYHRDKQDKNKASQIDIQLTEHKKVKAEDKTITFKSDSNKSFNTTTVINPIAQIINSKEEVEKSPHTPQQNEVANNPDIQKPISLPSIELQIKGKVDLDKINFKPNKKQTKKKNNTENEKKIDENLSSEKKKEDTKSVDVITELPQENLKSPENIIELKPEEDTLNEFVQTTETKVNIKPQQEADIEPNITPNPIELTTIKAEKIKGLTIINKVDLSNIPSDSKPIRIANDKQPLQNDNKKRKRIKINTSKERFKTPQNQEKNTNFPYTNDKFRYENKLNKPFKPTNKYSPTHSAQPVNIEIDEKLIQEKIKETQNKLTISGNKPKGLKAKIKKAKKEINNEIDSKNAEEKAIQVNEFLTVSELASLMDVNFADVISKCMSLGIMATINQRLDAEVIELVASEFNFKVNFVTLIDEDENQNSSEENSNFAELEQRPPIVTIMGHVDHGKTSLLDFIRNANVVAGEAGGITQHIGAYEVTLESGRKITFLDTPGHEAFTSMRARGAKVTDIAVIVIAADDAVMPQTKEAINHATAANVEIIFAINKIDKDGANAEKIYEQLSQMNYLVESWGGKYQNQEISAKSGLNINLLLEKILLQADILDLQARANSPAKGTIIEASLDKGRGNIATILVQDGTLNIGDYILSGQYFGRIKAIYNERNNKINSAGPSTPAIILGLNGAPQAGEKFKVYLDEAEGRELANKRSQLIREQGIRTKKHITLEEIGRRLALGNFKELNVIIKGDVDGSVEALSDSLQKLSTEEIAVKVIHKGVGQISESDVLLAAASDAIILGFNVRASIQANKLKDKEGVEIKLYSIIYNAIEEIKSAMEGLLEPQVKEKIIGNVSIKEIYKFDKVWVAGCMVIEGKIQRVSKIRLIRDGIVIYPKSETDKAELGSLKRFKDDVKEVLSGMECGLSIKNYNDIKVDDIIEVYEEEIIKRTL